MSSYYVKSLHYRIIRNEDIPAIFRPLKDDDFELEDFMIHIEGESAIVEMTSRYSDLDGARKIVEGYLSEWEIANHLMLGYSPFKFEYNNPVLIDEEEDNEIIYAPTLHMRLTLHQPRVFTNYYECSKPPKMFKYSEKLMRLWIRYRQWSEGKDTISAMAYYCVTVLEEGLGRKNRNNVANTYSIELSVLNKIADLSSDIGDDMQGRKFQREENNMRSYTSEEIYWIDKAIRKIIFRVGEYEANHNNQFEQITMSNI